MKRLPARVVACSAASAFCLAAALRLSAQATAPDAKSVEKEDTVVLSPFVVEASEDSGYAAKDTLAGTRIRTELKDVGASISVVTQKFLQDTNSKKAEELLVYVPNTEVVGQGGNFLGQGDGTFLTNSNLSKPVANTRVRGLAEADTTREFFLTDIPWDGYNVGRVDLQRGPNSILFGIGSPAGIVNSSLNQAAFKNSYKVEFQMDNFGTQRFSADVNQVLLKDQLALRLSLLHDDTKYRQDPAFRDDHRYYVAGRWDPTFFNKTGMHASLRASYENGTVDSNMPRYTPPLDAITPWFGLGRPLYDAQTSQQASQNNPWLGAPGGRVFDGVITAFNGASQDFTYPSQVKPWPNVGGAVPGTAVGSNGVVGINTYNAYANRAGSPLFPYTDIGPYKARSLTDPSIFNFLDNLLDGPNKHEFNEFHATNIAWSQTFLNDRIGYELAYDNQYAHWGYDSFISNDGSVVTVDLMRTLIDGSTNPNAGRPMLIAGGGSAGGYRETRTREVYRATAFGELNFADFTDKGSVWNTIFGRNTFTGLYTKQTNEDENRSYNRYYLSDSFIPEAGQGSVGQASRDDIFYIYLGSPMTGSSAANLGLQGLKNTVTPQTTTSINYFNNVTNTWQIIPMSIVNNDLASDRDKTYRLARKNTDEVKSSAIVWQGYWFDGAIIPMFGYRKDSQTFSDAGNPPAVPNNPSGKGGLVNPYDPSWTVPSNVPAIDLTSKTYSLVTHIPNSWRKKMPGNMDISLLYNQSENFKPDSGRRDIMGNPVPNPQGNTKEYGFAISAFDDKLTFKYAKYETKVLNATLDSNGIGGQYLIGAVEAWGQQFATQFKNSLPLGGPLIGAAGTLYGISSDGHQVTWQPDGPLQGTAGAFTYSQAQLDATYAKEKASVDAWFSPEQQVPASFRTAWALNDYATGGGSTNFGASGLVVTGDTISKGDEFELIARPVAGLDVTLNASKTHATRTNLAQSYVSWITKRWNQFLTTPAGNMRLWGPQDDFNAGNAGHGGETAKGKYQRETMSGYNLFQALQGADVPELKPWTFNVIANYAFQKGTLHGANVGGSYRWIDKSVTGFPVVGAGTATDPHRFNVDSPYVGSTQAYLDLWVGYEWYVYKKIKWRIQLNGRNVMGDDDLIKVTVQPDGSPGAYRIPEPTTWSITNTFSF